MFLKSIQNLFRQSSSILRKTNRNISSSILFRQQNQQQANEINITNVDKNVLISRPNPDQFRTGPPKITMRQRLGPHFFKIWVAYFGIIIVGITTFYFAKKEVDQNRQIAMKTKKDIFSNDEKYPNRLEMVRAEQKARKEREQQQQNQ